MNILEYLAVVSPIVIITVSLSMIIGDIEDRLNHIEDELRRK